MQSLPWSLVQPAITCISSADSPSIPTNDRDCFLPYDCPLHLLDYWQGRFDTPEFLPWITNYRVLAATTYLPDIQAGQQFAQLLILNLPIKSYFTYSFVPLEYVQQNEAGKARSKIHVSLFTSLQGFATFENIKSLHMAKLQLCKLPHLSIAASCWLRAEATPP